VYDPLVGREFLVKTARGLSSDGHSNKEVSV